MLIDYHRTEYLWLSVIKCDPMFIKSILVTRFIFLNGWCDLSHMSIHKCRTYAQYVYRFFFMFWVFFFLNSITTTWFSFLQIPHATGRCAHTFWSTLCSGGLGIFLMPQAYNPQNINKVLHTPKVSEVNEVEKVATDSKSSNYVCIFSKCWGISTKSVFSLGGLGG